MKKLIACALVLVLSLSLLAGCGSGGGSSNSGGVSTSTSPASTPATDNGNDADANLGENVILTSQLISLEDAKRLLGEGMEVNENVNDLVTVTNAMQISYQDTVNLLTLGIMFYQDALLSEWQLNNGGAKGIGDEHRLGIYEYDSDGAAEVEGVGDWAVVDVYVPTPEIRIGCGDYYMVITQTGRLADLSGQGATAAWKTEILIEAGKLAVERLEAIIN